ncbi:hypothetical protein ACFYNM_37765 [Streptomyces spororaveus]|uniref:hypothetical protein n=1 Tax=Streptomyces spororaveus TaxID=284039 RepID=UPI0036B1BE01
MRADGGGAAEYPLDWATVGDRPLYEADADLTGPLGDGNAHLSLVRDKAAPLPEPLAALLVEVAEAVATGLGTTRSKAPVLLLTAQNR